MIVVLCGIVGLYLRVVDVREMGMGSVQLLVRILMRGRERDHHRGRRDGRSVSPFDIVVQRTDGRAIEHFDLIND
jgi:hypothetical protein